MLPNQQFDKLKQYVFTSPDKKPKFNAQDQIHLKKYTIYLIFSSGDQTNVDDRVTYNLK